MKDSEYNELLRLAPGVVGNGLGRLIEYYVDDDDCLRELKEYIDDAKINGCAWNMQKAKIIFAMLQSRNKVETEKILSYLNHSECGWQGGSYHLYNHCLRHDRRCKNLFLIDNTPEATEDAFYDIDKIFLDKDYGSVTAYLFGYCIEALFSSKLKQDSLSVPYFLQIACERNSNAYRLIHEIVDICDVNTGILKNCYVDFDYGYCNCDHVTIFPAQSSSNVLDTLLYYRDIPVVIDGYENEKLYASLLRETANISGQIKKLGVKDRFNVLPIFICPSLKSSFRNVFSIDLTNSDVDSDYVELLEKNKERLSSWVFELVMNANRYFEQRNSIDDRIRRRGDGERPLFDNISGHINRLRKEYRNYTKLALSDVTNVGYLTYFLTRFMEAFGGAVRLSVGTKFIYRGNYSNHIPKKLIAEILKEITDTLFLLHGDCSPVLQTTVSINAPFSDSEKIKTIKKKGAKYAKDIIRYYQSYGVLITILPNAEYKDNRYVFSAKLLPGTDRKMISRYADEIRRLLDTEFFVPDITPSSIKLIVSETPLKENSLLKILASQKFKESTMEIPYAIGYDMMGEMVIADVAEFPHLVVGGTSGSGKSSALHSLLMSIVYRQPAEKVKLLLLDFGASGLKMFDQVPHMLCPTIRTNEIEKGRQCILHLQAIMEERLNQKDSLDEREFIKEYKKWPSIVCIIDEFPAFMRQLTEGKNNKSSSFVIEDLLARARKVKIHLILAAQDATQGGIGIKNTNLAAGIAFKCTNWHSSKAIIGEPDAINLSGKGAMYFKCDQHEGLKRLQGSYISTEEMLDMLDNMLFRHDNKYENVEFQLAPLQEVGNAGITQKSPPVEDENEKMLLRIVAWIQDKENISNNQLKHEFEMGYDRANMFLGLLEEAGIISKPKKGTKLPRTVYKNRAEEFLKNHVQTDDVTASTTDQNSEISSMPTNAEPEHEQNIESTSEMENIQKWDDRAFNKEMSKFVKKESFRGKSNFRRKRKKGSAQ